MSGSDSFRVVFEELPAPLRVGGLENACSQLANELRHKGIEVVRHSPDVPSRPLPEDGLPTVYHFHGLWLPEHARKASRLRQTGVPYVSSPHGMLEPWAWKTKRWKKWPYFQLVEKRRLNGSSSVLATAETEAKRIRALLPGASVTSIPLGTPLSRQPDFEAARNRLGWRTDETVLVYLSRIHPKKGLVDLIQALSLLEPELSDPRAIRLAVVGDGPEAYVNRCREAAKALRALRVDWVGPVWDDTKWDYLAGADLMCLPTYSENFGIVVLEACEVGTPVLTSNETPWQSIEDAGFGWAIEPGVGGCVDALRTFFQRPRAADSERGRLHSWTRDHFSWKELLPNYIQLYREALEHSKSIASAARKPS